MAALWAVPNYQAYQQRALVQTAQSALLSHLVAQTQYASQYGSYAFYALGNPPPDGFSAPALPKPYQVGARACSAHPDAACVEVYAQAPQLPSLSANTLGQRQCVRPNTQPC